MGKMDRWIRQYEQQRLGDKVGWTSSRYDLESKDWNSIRDMPIEGLVDERTGETLSFKQACSALRKSWKAWKISHRQYGYDSELGYRINRICYFLGLPLVEFENGPSVEWFEKQFRLEEETGERLSADEVQAKLEEDQENRSDYGIWDEDDDSKVGTLTEPEDPLYSKLREEEAEQEEGDRMDFGVWNNIEDI
jgi:hypothetical protein